MRQLNPLRKADVLNGFSPWASKPGRKMIDRLCRAVGRDTFARLNARIAQRWRQSVDEVLAGRFAASNARLAHMSGLPLAEYGYDLPAAPHVSVRHQMKLAEA